MLLFSKIPSLHLWFMEKEKSGVLKSRQDRAVLLTQASHCIMGIYVSCLIDEVVLDLESNPLSCD